MDIAKGARRLARRSINKVITELEAELAKEDCSTLELEHILQELVELRMKVIDLDNTILNFLLADPASTEQQQDAESSESEDLQRKIRRTMLKVERSLTSTVTHGKQSNNNSVVGAEAVSNNGSKKKFKVMKFEIKKFDGEYMYGLIWLAQ